ncbi:DUF6507 family protein [Arthrobacter sp. 7Tela_A1]|uniref:DUF6507 family protein n=1 Tax=Arthrobacter sp. 7Tela_A1 TaxID=3093745 RepID=UPI003BB6AC08
MRMPLYGYDVNPEGCANVLAQIEEAEGRSEALMALREGTEEAELACIGGSGIVGQALAELWQGTMSRQIQAAETRILNAVEGVREAVSIIASADREMADSARNRLAEVQAGILAEPELDGRL